MIYQNSIREHILGPDHPDTARTLHNLALLYARQKNYSEAERIYWRTFTIFEKALGAYHRATATNLHNIAELYKEQGQYEKADAVWRHTFAIRKYTLGLGHPDTQKILHHLREMYEEQDLGAQIEMLIDELQMLEPDELQEESLCDTYSTAKALRINLYFVQAKVDVPPS